jgi:hypothetical protein
MGCARTLVFTGTSIRALTLWSKRLLVSFNLVSKALVQRPLLMTMQAVKT